MSAKLNAVANSGELLQLYNLGNDSEMDDNPTFHRYKILKWNYESWFVMADGIILKQQRDYLRSEP